MALITLRQRVRRARGLLSRGLDDGPAPMARAVLRWARSCALHRAGVRHDPARTPRNPSLRRARATFPPAMSAAEAMEALRRRGDRQRSPARVGQWRPRRRPLLHRARGGGWSYARPRDIGDTGEDAPRPARRPPTGRHRAMRWVRA